MTNIQKTCRQCQTQFEITDEDLKFYDKVSPVFSGKKYPVPPPTLCPDCRQQRRLAFRNERKLYNRKCELCEQEIISIYSQDKPYLIYCQNCWWSDKWNAQKYAKDFDFNRPFFDQFEELQNAVPHLSMINNKPENSAYCNQTTGLKNCYLCFQAMFSEDCFYCKALWKSRNAVDCLKTYESELCYECVDCHNCYNCLYLTYCKTCNDSALCEDCTGCNDCFGCIGLRNKQYYIFNQPYSKEQYFQKINAIKSDPNWMQEKKKEFKELSLKVPHKHAQQTNCENCTGDGISNSKNALDCYDVVGGENIKYCYDLRAFTQNSYDITAIGNNIDFSYQTISSGINMRNCLFTVNCWEDIYNLLYCSFCIHGSHDCFGCIGLRHAKYCILNKQYSKEEYEKIVPRIIEHMEKSGQWGEFFPMILSAFAYNETVAQEYFQLSKREAIKFGFKWHEDELMSGYQGPKIEIPSKIQETPDRIIKQILTCETCGKNYKIIVQELNFYRRINVHIPHHCPNCRHKARLNLRNPRKLWSRTCAKCQTSIQTSYAPERPEIVYCEKCYLEAVY